MESRECSYDSAVVYGRQHGTAFYFNEENCTTFLNHIENRYSKSMFDAYYQGFMDGLDGKFKVQYRYMKVAKAGKGGIDDRYFGRLTNFSK